MSLKESFKLYRIAYLFLLCLILYSGILSLFSKYVYALIPPDYNTEAVRSIVDRIGRGTLIEMVIPVFAAMVGMLLMSVGRTFMRKVVFFIVLVLLTLVVGKGMADIGYQTVKTLLKPSYFLMQKEVNFLNLYPFERGSRIFIDPVTGTFISFKDNNKRFDLISDKATFFNQNDSRIFNPIFNDVLLFQDILKRDIDYIVVNTWILPLSTLKKFDRKPQLFKKLYQKEGSSNEPEFFDLNNLLYLYRKKDFISLRETLLEGYRLFVQNVMEGYGLVIYRVNKPAIREASSAPEIIRHPFSFREGYIGDELVHYTFDNGRAVKEIAGYDYLNSDVIMIDFKSPFNLKEVNFEILRVFPVTDSTARFQLFLFDKEDKNIEIMEGRLEFKENKTSGAITFKDGYHSVKTIYLHVYGETIDDKYRVGRCTIIMDNNEYVKCSMK